MNIFRMAWEGIKGMFGFGSKEITQALRLPESIVSSDMQNAMQKWLSMYQNKSPWLEDGTVFSLNLGKFVVAELSRLTTIEMEIKFADENGKENKRTAWFTLVLERSLPYLPQKLELGQAVGGLVIKPYVRNKALYWDFVLQSDLVVLAFNDDGQMSHVVFKDTHKENKSYYTRFEQHEMAPEGVWVRNYAFKSSTEGALGQQCPLTEVQKWEMLVPEVLVKDWHSPLFGYYRVPLANAISIDSPLGVSVFSGADTLIADADRQYSRLLWEYEAGEMAIDVDPAALKPKTETRNGKKVEAMPTLNKRLFRAVDVGADKLYEAYNPDLRDASFSAGLNKILMKIEDQCGLARGTISDPNNEVRTATELKILRQRTDSTITSNQAALEDCLRQVFNVMDLYATNYDIVGQGTWEAAFQWDDSIVTDSQQQLQERFALEAIGAMSRAEVRAWYTGETLEAAELAVKDIQSSRPSLASLLE